jgi:hypothetical protein
VQLAKGGAFGASIKTIWIIIMFPSKTSYLDQNHVPEQDEHLRSCTFLLFQFDQWVLSGSLFVDFAGARLVHCVFYDRNRPIEEILVSSTTNIDQQGLVAHWTSPWRFSWHGPTPTLE